LLMDKLNKIIEGDGVGFIITYIALHTSGHKAHVWS
jgi:hypothetical protein